MADCLWAFSWNYYRLFIAAKWSKKMMITPEDRGDNLYTDEQQSPQISLRYKTIAYYELRINLIFFNSILI